MRGELAVVPSLELLGRIYTTNQNQRSKTFLIKTPPPHTRPPHTRPTRPLHTSRPSVDLCRRYGADVVLRAGVTVWSAMTLITPLAAQHSIPALVLVRVLMGVGEGVSQPTIHALLSQWTPVVERSRSVVRSLRHHFGPFSRIFHL